MEQQRPVDGVANKLCEAPRGSVYGNIGVQEQEQRQA